MAAQLPFNLPHRPSFAREDFLLGQANRAALAAVDGWPDGSGPALLLVGPAGSGKTHLADIWRARLGADRIAAGALTETRAGELTAGSALVVEDLDRGAPAEQALFHLLNRAREAGAHLLLTSGLAPAQLPVGLPDLRSRLVAVPQIAIEAPDDDLLRQVLIKHFADRQLAVSAPTIDFIVRRMERSLAAARALATELDKRALAEGRAVTRALAAAVLADLADLAEP